MSLIRRFRDFRWAGAEERLYKDVPGSHLGVVRFALDGDGQAGFQARYFEVQPGGYTSFERHEHEHCVVVLRGRARLRLGSEWHEIGDHDVVNIGPSTPHQFRCLGEEPFGMLCIVDKVRDRPELLDTEESPEASD